MGRMNKTPRSHIAALICRDLRDAVRNRTVLVMVAACLAIAGLLNMVAQNGVRWEAGEASAFLMTSVMCAAPAFVGCVVTLYVMAEECERGMYVTLAEAGVSLAEIAVAKLIACLVVTVAVEVLLCGALQLGLALSAATVGLSLLSMLPVLFAGAACGLLATEQMASSVFAVPITLVAVMPMIAFLSPGLRQIWWMLPAGQAAEVARVLCGMGAMAPMPLLVGLMLAWAVAATALLVGAYRRATVRLQAELDRVR